jgi:sulfur-oxidizing protein SoxZ
MVAPTPRVQVPATAAKGEVVQIKTLISHPMETGLRHDSQGKTIPRRIINKFVCRYDGEEVFSIDLHEAMAANPFLEFHVRATKSGRLRFEWVEDGGAVFTLASTLTVG